MAFPMRSRLIILGLFVCVILFAGCTTNKSSETLSNQNSHYIPQQTNVSVSTTGTQASSKVCIHNNETWETWIQAASSAAFPARVRHTSLVYDNRMWVIGGEGDHGELLNDVWSSADGANWSEANGSAAFSGRYDPLSLVYNDQMWIIGGWGIPGKNVSDKIRLNNDVWYSSDGIQWYEANASAAFPPRAGATAITYANEMWIMGGANESGIPLNDVWYSSDGIQWHEANASAAFSPRDRATSVTYANKMWIIGGDSGIPLNDAWYSSDGIQWHEANASAAFLPRVAATSVVYNNRMWEIGGGNGGETASWTQFFNDVWSSSDGSNWTQAQCKNLPEGSVTPTFQPRELHTSVVYHDRIWIIAGALNMPDNPPFDIRFMNDTWYFEEST